MKNKVLTLVKPIVYVIIAYMKDIEKQLKQAMIDSSMTRAEIVRKSKNQLSEAQLSYFVNDKRSLTLPAAAKLAKVLGLELRPKRKAGKK
ncbi:MAG: helix-turn-helix transcriptional regulator [Sedimentisphaerales bacterium]